MCSALSSHYKKDIDLADQEMLQKNWFSDWRTFHRRKGWGRQDFFSLEKVQGGLINDIHIFEPREWWKGSLTFLSSAYWEDTGNGHQSKYTKFHLNIKTFFFSFVRVVKCSKQGTKSPSLEKVNNLTGRGPKQSALEGLCFEQGESD